MTASKTMHRQVFFSDDITVRIFEYPSRDEISKRWHSKADKALFRQELARDVRCIRFLLSATPMEALEKEAPYKCIGLEALLSAKVTRVLRENKRGHVRSIAQVQDSLSEEQLAAYAESRSSLSRERAQKLAAGYLEILS